MLLEHAVKGRKFIMYSLQVDEKKTFKVITTMSAVNGKAQLY